MDSRIREIYGYAVCLVAIITFLVSISSFVSALLALSQPSRSEYGYGPATTFEEYVALQKERPAPYAAYTDTLSEEEWRKRWEATRAAAIDRGRYAATRSLLTSAVLMLLAVVLFAGHWRWLRRMQRAGT